MSEDPHTARQIAGLAADERPLLVADVDEVVLEFVRPFMDFLETRNHFLRTDSFRLTGNVIDKGTGQPAEASSVAQFLEGFFAEQEQWQSPVEGAGAALSELGEKAAIVMLTAMPHRHHHRRRVLLDRLGLDFPLVTTEAAKGPAIAAMRARADRPVAFIDDIPHNHVSVRKSLPDAALFHLMAFHPLKKVMPPLPDGISATEGWADAAPAIARALNIE